MAKKNKNPEYEAKKRQEDREEQLGGYTLNTKAVDDLVEAHREPEKVKSVEDINAVDQYQTSILSKIPVWVKALFLKYWFAGAVYFFIGFGLGSYLTDSEAMIIVLGGVMGLTTDVLLNNIFMHFQSDKEYNSFMMVPVKKFWTLFINLIYAVIVVLCVVFTYNIINKWIIASQGLPATDNPLPVEPLLFGLFYLAYDMAFIGIKNLIVYLARKASGHKTSENGD